MCPSGDIHIPRTDDLPSMHSRGICLGEAKSGCQSDGPPVALLAYTIPWFVPTYMALSPASAKQRTHSLFDFFFAFLSPAVGAKAAALASPSAEGRECSKLAIRIEGKLVEAMAPPTRQCLRSHTLTAPSAPAVKRWSPVAAILHTPLPRWPPTVATKSLVSVSADLARDKDQNLHVQSSLAVTNVLLSSLKRQSHSLPS